MSKSDEVEKLIVQNTSKYFKCDEPMVAQDKIIQCEFTSIKSSDLKSHKKNLDPKFECPFCQGTFRFVYSTAHLNDNQMDKFDIWAPSRTMGAPFSKCFIR